MLLLVNMIFPTHEHALGNTNGEKFSYPNFFVRYSRREVNSKL